MATPILALASTKGGVGKTTLAFCIATELARRRLGSPDNRPIACIDADPNRTLAETVNRGRPAGVIAEVATGETLLAAVTEASRKAAAVVIDLEGTANQAMLYAFGKAHVVLIPAQPSQFDVVEAVRTAGVAAQAADLTGRDIVVRVVLSRTPVLRQRVTEHSRKQFVSRGLTLLQAEMMERTAFRQMTYTGQPPWMEDPESGAAANVAAITDEIFDLLGMA
jgi:chromosome partitioning protein